MKRSLPVLLAIALLLLLGAAARPAAVRAEDDGCDPSLPIACLPPPEEAPQEDPAGRATPDIPSAAAPAPPPPVHCPPQPVRSIDGGSEIPAAPAPPPAGCQTGRDVAAAVNRANAAYARAVMHVNERELLDTWTGPALAELRNQIAVLRAEGRYVTPQLLSIRQLEMRLFGSDAYVRTLEHWVYTERLSWSGAVWYEADQWVENRYTLRFSNSRWRVVQDEIIPAAAPYHSLQVRTDRNWYRSGEPVAVTITNDGGLTITGASGCGLARLEWQGPGGWQPPTWVDRDIPCPAIALLLAPGRSRTERIAAPAVPGIYRAVVRYSAEGEPGGQTAVSAPFEVW